MNELKIAMALISAATLLGYTSATQFRIQPSIAILTLSLLIVITANIIEPITGHLAAYDQIAHIIQHAHFQDLLMDIMLPILLFAGAMSMNAAYFKKHQWTILILAIVSTIASTFLIGYGFYAVMQYLGTPMELIYCLLFGALISPTDPVAVLGILKQAKVPRSMEIQIAGESLFNDGIGVVAFIVLSEIAVTGHTVSAEHIGLLFVEEAVGGALFGFVIGWLTYRLLKSVDNYQVEVLLTLALVMGGYALASAIHISGPIAVVVAGLFIGNHGRRFAMSETTRLHLDGFWKLTDEILNALLFVLIGMEVLVLTFSGNLFIAGLLAIPAILLARWVSVSIPVLVIGRWRTFIPGTISILTWGGLRGGISVALALSLPPGREREILLAVTYTVVIFSILVQGLTLRRVARLVVKAES